MLLCRVLCGCCATHLSCVVYVCSRRIGSSREDCRSQAHAAGPRDCGAAHLVRQVGATEVPYRPRGKGMSLLGARLASQRDSCVKLNARKG